MFTRMNRRSFVRAASATALAAGMAPLLVPAAVLGRVKGAAPNDRIGLGFIGMGIQNRFLLRSFLNDATVRVVAVCDVDTTRREHARRATDETYAGTDCRAYNDHRELLERKDVDAVVISTPDHWHAIQVLDAFAAGKDVYCEKPLTLTIHEAKAIIDASTRHGRVLQTGSQQRTENEGRFRTACEYVRSGRIGEVTAVHVGIGVSSVPCDLPEEPMEPGLDWDRWLGPAPARPYNSVLSPRGINDFYPNWRLYREYSGGMMTDWGAHHYDIAQWALGMDASGPVEVHPPRDPKAMYGARFVYDNGVQMFHGGPRGVTFVGAKGVIQVDRDRLWSLPDSILKEPLTEKDVKLPGAPNHRQNWLDCLRSRAKPICDAEVGGRSVTICHLANLVYWHRRSLRWDPAAWNFGADREANQWMDYDRRAPYRLPTV